MKRAIRKATEEDVSFVFSTILNCLRHDSKFTWPIDSATFFNGHKKLLERIFLKPTTQVMICCDEDDPVHIFGYLIAEPPKILHFVYVKKALREAGVANQLLESVGIKKDLEGTQFTHYTNMAEKLKDMGKIKWGYNPYLLMEA